MSHQGHDTQPEPPERDDADAASDQSHQLSPMRSFWENWLKPILIVVFVLMVFRSAVADWHDVPTGSMRPTILEGDRIVVNKLAYDLRIPFTDFELTRWSTPSRGEVVTFWAPGDGTRMVKRIVAVGGDEIQLREGRLYVNGQRADYQPLETANNGDILGPQHQLKAETLNDRTYTVQFEDARPRHRNFGPETIPENHYFMVGDNRDNSSDSRRFGVVHENDVVGRAFGVALSFDGSILNPQWNRWFTSID